ncbi:MAG: carboxypeptidase-like regulatory domain-containing protein, partial [Bacteroidota bacterium]
MRKLLAFLLVLQVVQARAATISGLIKDKSGNAIAFASVLIKGTTKGTTANAKGFYSLEIESGNHILVVQH